MMLADMGADVIRVDRAGAVTGGDPDQPPKDTLTRNRRSIGVDLKNPDGVEAVLTMVESADGLIEGFRPGVMERMGLGVDALHALRQDLVIARISGFGPEGPMSAVRAPACSPSRPITPFSLTATTKVTIGFCTTGVLSHRHGSRDVRVRLVPLESEVIVAEVVETFGDL